MVMVVVETTRVRGEVVNAYRERDSLPLSLSLSPFSTTESLGISGERKCLING